MKRLIPLVLLVAAACDRSTPAMSPVPRDTATPTVAISTTLPSPSAERTAAPRAAMPKPPRDAVPARVLRVSDGDTVVLSAIRFGEVDRTTGGRKARLIGIDTPEVFGTTECFGREASAFTKRALDGADVLVAADVDPTDQYGRALVYIWERDGTFFNGRLAAEGYALQATFPPNVRYVDVFASLVRQAREGERGLWSSCR